MRYFVVYILLFLTGLLNRSKASPVDSFTLEYPYIHYTTQDGLPSNEIFSILQDSRGYIWIGTDRGLVKYDGYEFKTYTTLDGLTDNVISALLEDDNGNIWYTGLNTLKVAYIDPQMNFKVYKHNDVLIDSINAVGQKYSEEKRFNHIHFNSLYSQGDKIYLVNRTRGYIVLSDSGVEKVELKFSHSGNTYYVKNGNLDFIYSDKCFLNHMNIETTFHFNEKQIGSYKRRRTKSIFPTVVKKDSSVFVYDDYDFIQYNKGNALTHELLKERCSAFQLSGNRYFYSTYGFNKLNKKIYYSQSANINDPKELIFEGGRISGILEDNNGGIWICTVKNGIIYIPSLLSKRAKLGFPIETIYKNEGSLILGYDGGYFKGNTREHKFVQGKKILSFSGLEENISKKYFFLVQNFNLNENSISQEKTELEILFDPLILSLSGYQILSDSLKYYHTRRKLFKITEKGLDVSFPVDFSDYGSVFVENTYCFKEDSCLLGTKSGLYRLYEGKLTPIDLVSKEKRVRHIDYLKENKCVIFSVWGEGIYLKFDNGKFLRLTEEDGLNSHVVNDLFIDENNIVWIATNKGLNTLTLNEDNIPELKSIFKSSKLLCSPNILQVLSYKDKLYLGTDSGFDIVDLNKLDIEKEFKQPLFIESIQINKEEQSSIDGELHLNYDKNNIVIQYNSIAYKQFGNINYRYRLNGLSEDWVYTKERKANFLQLADGNYNFELQAQNDQGNWISLDVRPQFHINPPYWESWWFRMIILVVICLVVYYYVSNVKKEREFLKKENRFVENEKVLSEELNTTRQKALSSQLNPHFVFNSLNSIQNFILTRRTELSSDYLSMFSKLMRFVFENSKKLYVPLFDEIEALKLYLELEQVRHNHKFDYTIDRLNLETHNIFIPSLLIQPIIENAIWHGLLHKKEKDRQLKVSFAKKDAQLIIEIKDNGVGRNASSPSRPKMIKKQQSSGVELTKQRLNLLSQSVKLDTHFEVVDLFSEDGNPSGTLVRITIPILSKEHI